MALFRDCLGVLDPLNHGKSVLQTNVNHSCFNEGRWDGSSSSYTHTHSFNGPFSGTTQVSRYQKVKPILILLKKETVSVSDISWAIFKSAPCSRQITTPAPHHSVFLDRMPFLPPNQQRQSTEALCFSKNLYNNNNHLMAVCPGQPG